MADKKGDNVVEKVGDAAIPLSQLNETPSVGMDGCKMQWNLKPAVVAVSADVDHG